MAAPDDAINIRRRGVRIDCERLKARIERNVFIDDSTGCWLWTRRLKNSGYGSIGIRIPGYAQPRKFLVHRVAYELWKGRIKRGLVIAHSCDNKRCCNPEHLSEATVSENLKQWYARGRTEKRYTIEAATVRPLLEPHLLPIGEAPYERTAAVHP